MGATIECKPDGPYLVKELATLHDAAGNALAAKPAMALCRCGGSKTKPFCDGTHRTNGFSGARVGGLPDKRDDYRGRGITIHDNRSICAHAGHCTDGLAAVFKYGAEPWIDPDGAPAAATAEVIHRCPSGALSYQGAQPQQGNPAIVVTKDGPYAVKRAELVGAQWAEGASPDSYTLCRCGGSKNKPFCDGTHWSIGFKG